MWPPTTIATTPLHVDNDGDDDDDDGTTTTTTATTTALGLEQSDRDGGMWPSVWLPTPPQPGLLAAGRLQEPWQPFIFNGEAKRRPQTLGRPTACWGFVMLGLPGTDAVASPRAQSPPRPARPGSDEIP
ncbi:hypothetical protein T069G_09830 [Trichoderma breve]|uniref:Uncharacterized protein n=1 Tax=Trichoderma breve TaxID=2034170 RepID=A0A9W9E4N0_9HYPO|nr:hypothetical protein T069G_09830 [Trichoderma breve]KAJ4856462.1 hypothetical protein T069G_09830 [Trichoderma breve]